MTVTSQTSRYSYDGNGATTVFPFPTYFIAATDLKVVKRAADGTETTLTRTTHYTVSGAGDPAGGSVTMLSAPASGEKLVIYLDPPLTQTTSYAAGRFPAASHEKALDRGVQMNQRTREMIGRAPMLAETDVDGAGAFDARGNRIADLGAPVASTDAATKGYVDDTLDEAVNDTDGVLAVKVAAAEGHAADALAYSQVSRGWAEGPVPSGGTHSSKGWAEVAQANAAISDTARAAVELAISEIPSDTTLLLEAVAVSVLKGVAADTPIGRLAYLAAPGREGIWQLRADDYTARVAADTYNARYIAVDAISPSVAAWERIIPDNRFRFSWTGLNADTADALPYLQAGFDLFDANSKWELPPHALLLPSNVNPALLVDKPGVHLYGFGRATHFDYGGVLNSFEPAGLGLIQMAANDTQVSDLRISLRAPNNSAANPAVISVSADQAVLDATDDLPELSNVVIRNIDFDRTSTGILVGAYAKSDHSTGFRRPSNILVENIHGISNGAAVSLFGGENVEVRDYHFEYVDLPSNSPAAKKCGFRVLGSVDVRIGDGMIDGYQVGVQLDPAYFGARALNRDVRVYGEVEMRDVTLPIVLFECEGEFRVSKATIRRSLENTDGGSISSVVKIVGNSPLSTVPEDAPEEDKSAVVDDILLENIDAEGYALGVFQQGESGKLKIRGMKVVGNANTSTTLGERGAVRVIDAFGLPSSIHIDDSDFRMTIPAGAPSMYLGASGGLIEVRRNKLPERDDPESSIEVHGDAVFYSDGVEQRLFRNAPVNLGTNIVYPVGALAHWRDGTPLPEADLPTAAAWTRDLTSATVTESPTGTFTKTGPDAAFDGRVSSVDGLVGDFELVYRLKNIVGVSEAVAVGIDAVADQVAYGTIDWSVMYGPGGADYGLARPYNNSTPLSIARSYTTSTIERWRREGSRLIFSRNNIDLFDVSVSPDIAFKLHMLFARVNDSVEILRFGAI